MGKREENKQRKQQAILEAALKTFSTKGYADARIAEVAQAAHVGKGTIYEYYQSKEDLFFGVFQWYVEKVLMAGLQNAGTSGDAGEERLRRFLNAAVDSSVSTLDYFAITLEFWAAAGNPTTRDRFRGALLNLYKSFRLVIAELIAEGQRTGAFRPEVDPEALAAGLMGSLDGLMLQGWMDNSFKIKAVADTLIETTLCGIRT